MASPFFLLLATVVSPTVRYGFLTGKLPARSFPVLPGYPPIQRRDLTRPLRGSSSLVLLSHKISDFSQFIPELVRSIEDLNPSSTYSETVNTPAHPMAVSISFEQFKVWSIFGDLPVQKTSFPLFASSMPDELYLPILSPAETSSENIFSHTVTIWAAPGPLETFIKDDEHPQTHLLSFLIPERILLSTPIDWTYILQLRSTKQRVYIHGLASKIHFQFRLSTEASRLFSFLTSANLFITSVISTFTSPPIYITHLLVRILCVTLSSIISVLIVHPTRELRRAVFIFTLAQLFQYAAAAGSNDDQTGPKCKVFDGVNLTFMPWLISFSAWVAWKKPELVALLSGTSARPTPAGSAPTAAEQRQINEWNLLNVQLYGALVSFISPALQAAIYVDAINDGVKGLSYLRTRFGATSTGDRAEATQRLQRSYIDSRAKLSEADVTHQYNEMQIAAADIVSAGGSRPDDQLLISMFENALPPAYAHIRQMVRYKAHPTLTAFYNDLLTQVKAEARSSSALQFGAFQTQFRPAATQNNGKGRGGKGMSARGRGGARTGRGTYFGSNPCFNCLGTDHTRDQCPRPPVTCLHCSGGHQSELCPLGNGGPARDALTENARRAVQRQADYASSRRTPSVRNHSAYAAQNVGDESVQCLANGIAAYLTQQRRIQTTTEFSAPTSAPSRADAADAPEQRALVASTANEMDDFLSSLSSCPRAHMARSSALDLSTPGLASIPADADAIPADAVYAVGTSSSAACISAVALIDSQATHFVVPSRSYLLRVLDDAPRGSVDTANGSTQPSCTGVAGVHILDDCGSWSYFEVYAIVLHACTRVLYSQRAMSQCGVRHFLDDGYLVLPNGRKAHIHPSTYSIELSFGPPTAAAYAARTSLVPASSNPEVATGAAGPARGRGADSRSLIAVPQRLLWSRLGFPSEHAWRRVPDMLVDHGLPGSSYLRFDFPVSDAVAQARSRALPFHTLRDPDQIPAPGSLVHLDFAGPMIDSYPHRFRFYCGAVDAGSGYSRVLACHGPTKEAASSCLSALLSDMRAHMNLSHRILPHVVVTDQGSAFMSSFFRDFLSDNQVRHYPSAVYTPQQNAYVERMWGVRFSMARALMAHAHLGPSLHPYALQTANWICNRLPSSSRSWLSPYYILSRRPASVAYLRSFGCLVRAFLAPAQRQGDRHFADRGQLGIYLGPSEQSPAVVVYLPSRRQFLVTRHVVFYEDVHPGVRQLDSSWRVLEQEGDRRLTVSHGEIDRHAPLTLIDAVRDDPMRTLESSSPADRSSSAITTPVVHTVPDAAELPLDSPADADNTFDTAAPSRLPSADSADPTDPSSRAFVRNLPRRATRYQGAYYADPSACSLYQATRNAQLRNWWEQGDPHLGAHFAYHTSICGTIADAYAVTSTSDMGDIRIPRGYRQAMESAEAPYWKEAIDRELNGLMQNRTWDVLPLSALPPGSNLMRCHMVFTVKRLADGSIEKFKCRLVADGNTQRYGVDFNRIFSTVAKLSTLRLFLAIAAARGYRLTSVDIRQAYLQADLNENLYMHMPPGLPDSDSQGNKLIVKLRKSLYGLRQAGREWADLLSEFLITWGFHRSIIDICLYTYSDDGSLLSIVVWVDDCVIMDNCPALRDAFVKDLNRRFPVEDKGDLEWILQVKVSRNWKLRTLALSQELYVSDLVHRFSHLLPDDSRRYDCPCDPSTPLMAEQCPAPGSLEHDEMASLRETYMSLVGAFLWLSNMTRFEIGYIVTQLARFVSNPSRVHFKAAIRVLVYLRTTKERSLILHPCKETKPELRVFVDSNWGTKFSVSGAVFEFMGAIIHWFSRTQRSVSMSSTEAEYFAASMATRDALFLRELLADLGFVQNYPTPLRTDNKGVVDLSFDPVAFKKTKHILRAAEFLRDSAARRKVTVVWLSGADNVADILTKLVNVSVFRHLISLSSRISQIP